MEQTFPISHFIKNVSAASASELVGEKHFSLLIAKDNFDDSYISSPYGQYIAEAKSKLHLIENEVLAKFANVTLTLLGRLIRRARINSIVYVNHSFTSTDLHPQRIADDELQQLITKLQVRFPEHAIAFRTVNPYLNSRLIRGLKQNGFQLIASRKVHITNPKQQKLFASRIVKSDLRLLDKTTFTVTEEKQLNKESAKEALELYQKLYLRDHSPLSPDLTEIFLEKRELEYIVVREGEKMRGVAGYFIQEGVLFSPFFGYDKEENQQMEIYRLLSTKLLLKAREKGLFFHQSSGASFYKVLRHAKTCLDYHALYTKHLSLTQKISWWFFRTFINLFAPRYMKKS